MKIHKIALAIPSEAGLLNVLLVRGDLGGRDESL